MVPKVTTLDVNYQRLSQKLFSPLFETAILSIVF
jgi:hypothetical protein